MFELEVYFVSIEQHRNVWFELLVCSAMYALLQNRMGVRFPCCRSISQSMSVGYIHLGNTVCSLGWGDHIFEIWDNTFRVFVDSILFWGQNYSWALTTAINLVEILDAPSECDAWVFKDRVNAFFSQNQNCGCFTVPFNYRLKLYSTR